MWPSPVPAGERDKLFKVGLVDKNGIVQPINSKTELKKVMKDCKHLRALTMRVLLGMGTLAQKDAKLKGMVSAATVRKVCEQLTLSRDPGHQSLSPGSAPAAGLKANLALRQLRRLRQLRQLR